VDRICSGVARHPGRVDRRHGAEVRNQPAHVWNEATFLTARPAIPESSVRHFVRLDAGDDIGAIRVVVQDVILDLVVVLEAQIAIGALMGHDLVRHDLVVAPRRPTVQRRRSPRDRDRSEL
jgi:hypothetical protein